MQKDFKETINNSNLKTVIHLVLIVIITLPLSVFSQWTYLGLGDKMGSKIELFNNEIYVGTNDGMYKKNFEDNDTTWSFLGLQGKWISDFIIFNIDTLLVSTFLSGIDSDSISLFMTYNGGTDWSNFQNGFGGNSGFYSCSALEFNKSAPDTIFARAGMCIAKSIDRGITWQEVHENWSLSGYQDFLFDIDHNNPATIWAGGEGGFLQPYLLKSVDYGNSWQLNNIDTGGDNACYSLLTYPNNYNEILVGMEGRIIKSIDGGESWYTIFTSSTYAYLIDMEISPNNDNLVYATGFENGVGGGNLFFYKSYNFGVSWDTVTYHSNSFSYYINDLEIKSEGIKDELLFATNKGIYQFSDSLTSAGSIANEKNCFWTLYPNPMTDYATLNFNNFKRENHTLTLYNKQGHHLQTYSNITTNHVKIIKDNLPNGLYIFQLHNGSKLRAIGKLMIK
jgi:hypothetical protein